MPTEVADPVVVPEEVINDDTKRILGNIMRPREKTDETPGEPPMYAVILWNDNSTNPMFVIRVLVEAFQMPHPRAAQVMYSTHLGTRNAVMVVTKDEAETRLAAAEAIIAQARPNVDWYVAHSARCELRFTIEPESDEKK